jgi:Family of unknown function (DUF6600)
MRAHLPRNLYMMTRTVLMGVCVWGVLASVARAQEAAPPPAYLAVVEGNATLEREGEVVPAEQNMPFVQGDRLRTLDGRVQIVFPDGSAIEVAENSAVECISPSRVRLLAGTMDHVQRAVGGGGTESAAHLPPELNVYGGTFDQNGSWQYDAPYGYVWYPTVAADWRPYYYGYWSSVPTYGYTWIGVDAWSWPTHHYGRWGYARNRWFWIPGRTWSAAWVSWASAPGYVSWCPLGFDGRPVFAFYGFGRSFAGWTVLPRGDFGGHRYYANRYGVDPRRLPTNVAFVAHNTPPRADRIGRANVNNGPSVGVAVPRRQPPATSSQPPTARRPATTGGAIQSAAVAARPAPATNPVPPAENAPTGNGFGRPSPNGRPGVPMHYGIAPRPTPQPSAIGGSIPIPGPAPTPGPAPAPNYAPRPFGPSGDRPFAPIGVPRTSPSNGGPTLIAPAQPGPGPAPVAAPPYARPAPGAAPQGEARPRGEARPQGEGRPQGGQGGEGRSQGEGRARGGRGRSH